MAEYNEEGKSEPFVRRGTGPIKADEVLNAIAEGRDINIQQGIIEGDLDIQKIEDRLVLECGKPVIQGRINIVNCKISGDISFNGAKFSRDAFFSGAKFSGNAIFGGAKFMNASFSGAKFSRDAFFSGAKFMNASFSGASFKGADFIEAVLMHADFRRASFMDASFSGAIVRHAHFRRASFMGVDFSGATFVDADFGETIFSGIANFSLATFNSNADFSLTTFSNNADFSGATFTRRADFNKAIMEYPANFSDVRFHESTASAGLWNHILKPTVSFLSIGKVKLPEMPITDFSKFNTTTVMDGSSNPYLKRYIDHEQWIASWRERSRLRKFLFFFWELTCHCGRSVGLWLFWSLVVAVAFGAVYADYTVPSWFPPPLKHLLISMDPHLVTSPKSRMPTPFTPFYFSIVTFTTLGFGDVTPLNLAGEICVVLEAFIGAIMVGVFLSIFASKLARRA